MSEQVSYRWKPMSGLPEDSAKLASSELRSLAQVWIEQKDGLAASEALETFNGSVAAFDHYGVNRLLRQ